MAVTEVREYSVKYNAGTDGRRNYTVVYKVVTDDATDTPLEVLNGTNLPQYRSALAFSDTLDSGVFLTSTDVDYWDYEASRKLWRVVMVYSNMPVRSGAGGVDPTRTGSDPALFLPRITGSFISEVVRIDRDVNDKPVVNPVKDEFRDAFRTKAKQTLRIEKNYTSIDVATIGTNVDKLNANEFFDGAAGTWKLDNAEWQQVYYGAVPYYEVRYEFSYNPDGWTFKPKIEGPRYFVDITDKETRAVEVDLGFAYGDGYAPLNPDGTLLPPTEEPFYYGVWPFGVHEWELGEISYQMPDRYPAFEIYDSIDFPSQLSIPSGF